MAKYLMPLICTLTSGENGKFTPLIFHHNKRDTWRKKSGRARVLVRRSAARRPRAQGTGPLRHRDWLPGADGFPEGPGPPAQPASCGSPAPGPHTRHLGLPRRGGAGERPAHRPPHARSPGRVLNPDPAASSPATWRQRQRTERPHRSSGLPAPAPAPGEAGTGPSNGRPCGPPVPEPARPPVLPRATAEPPAPTPARGGS